MNQNYIITTNNSLEIDNNLLFYIKNTIQNTRTTFQRII